MTNTSIDIKVNKNILGLRTKLDGIIVKCEEIINTRK